jgi:hypothetical protein
VREPYPEQRGSRLAAQKERKRAERRLRKLDRKKREKEQAMQQNGQHHANGQVNGSAAKEPGPPPPPTQKRRKPPLGAPLASEFRDAIIRAIERWGLERVIVDLSAFAKDRTRSANQTIMRKVLNDPAWRFNSTTNNLLRRLALHYCGDQQALPLPGPARTEAFIVRATSASGPLTLSDVKEAAEAAANAALERVLAKFQPQAAASEFRQSPAPLLGEYEGAAFPALDAFEDRTSREQAEILRAMHHGYAHQVRDRYGIIGGEHAYAWNISYEAYRKETGLDVKARATAESRRTGESVTPLSLILKDGDVVRFWQIVRKTWERAPKK